MDLDRQAIERRDFPVTRRGYEPAAVDAHLRALASEFEEHRRAASGGESSLASTAGTQVQSILAATEAAAADIESQALEHAHSVREAADADAQRTRGEAIERARAHTAAVAQATAALLERIESMDGELGSLLESLRGGGGRLATDLAALGHGMGELYDAASTSAESAAAHNPSPPAGPRPPAGSEVRAQTPPAAPPRAAAPTGSPAGSDALSPTVSPGPTRSASPATAGDLDGARLIALNMALNGDSREEAERYLAEHFQSIDRLQLIDEVYAAIEG